MKRRRVGDIARSKYWREADARAVIEAWRRSGESLAGFARRHGIRGRRLSRWSKRLDAPVRPSKARRETRQVEPVVLHPVHVVDRHEMEEDGVAGRIEIELPDGIRVRVPAGCTGEELRRVLGALRETPPC